LLKLLFRFAVYVCIFVVFVGGIGWFGYDRSYKDFYGTVFDKPVPSLQGVKPPAYDPNKPTVAVLLANVDTEVFDFMIPYDLFSRTGGFNVFAVAPDKNVKSLSGGLDVVPHYTYQELDQLLGKSPDIIVVPYMPIVDEKKYQPTREWIQQHSSNKTTLLSICGGSSNLADAGLLKGKSATTHWQSMPALMRKFPETKWREDLRYVHDGNIVSSAGQTAGIDAVLYVISQKLGEPMAAKIAKEIHYPSYHFVQNPKVDPFHIDLRFTTYVLNYAFHWNKEKTGVLLYNGMEEIALSSIFDTYADTGTTQVLTVSSLHAPIVTKHHLNLVARYQISNAPKLDKMIVSGADARSLAAEDIQHWNEQGHAKELLFMHSDSPDRYVFEAPLEDLAKQEDLLTAQHAVKRLEYRANNLKLEGNALPLETYGNLLLTAVIAVLAALYIDRRFILKKTTSKLK
jgi:AraC family transcriptional regulator, transcriptional activator FtrA